MTVDDLYNVGASLIGGGAVGGVLVALLKSALNAALSDLQANVSKHLTPNGGNSAYDQITECKNLAQKALNVSIANEAELKRLSDKLDALVLSRVS